MRSKLAVKSSGSAPEHMESSVGMISECVPRQQTPFGLFGHQGEQYGVATTAVDVCRPGVDLKRVHPKAASLRRTPGCCIPECLAAGQRAAGRADARRQSFRGTQGAAGEGTGNQRRGVGGLVMANHRPYGSASGTVRTTIGVGKWSEVNVEERQRPRPVRVGVRSVHMRSGLATSSRLSVGGCLLD